MKKRSAKERQEYHFEMSRKGSTNLYGEPISDFQRGVHLGKAQAIQKQRMNCAKYYKRLNRRQIKKVFE